MDQVRLILELECLFQMNFSMLIQQILLCYCQPCLLCELICSMHKTATEVP
jgi:hypothetical protein